MKQDMKDSRLQGAGEKWKIYLPDDADGESGLAVSNLSFYEGENLVVEMARGDQIVREAGGDLDPDCYAPQYLLSGLPGTRY